MKLFLIVLVVLFAGMSSKGQSIYLTTSGGSFSTEKWVSITTGINGTGIQVWGQGNGTYGDSPGLVSDVAVDVSAYCGQSLYVNAVRLQIKMNFSVKNLRESLC